MCGQPTGPTKCWKASWYADWPRDVRIHSNKGHGAFHQVLSTLSVECHRADPRSNLGPVLDSRVERVLAGDHSPSRNPSALWPWEARFLLVASVTSRSGIGHSEPHRSQCRPFRLWAIARAAANDSTIRKEPAVCCLLRHIPCIGQSKHRYGGNLPIDFQFYGLFERLEVFLE